MRVTPLKGKDNKDHQILLAGHKNGEMKQPLTPRTVKAYQFIAAVRQINTLRLSCVTAESVWCTTSNLERNFVTDHSYLPFSSEGIRNADFFSFQT